MNKLADGTVQLASRYWPKRTLLRVLGRSSVAGNMARRRRLYHGVSTLVKDIMRYVRALLHAHLFFYLIRARGTCARARTQAGGLAPQSRAAGQGGQS